MKPTSIKQQATHYLSVLVWMIRSYYKLEKRSFWLIQTVMGLSVVLGLLWLLGLIAGLNHLNDSQYLNQFRVTFLADIFNLPLWVWLSLLSIAGLLSAGFMFLSFHLGVKSIIRYQVKVLHQLLEVINQNDQVGWLSVVEDEPRKKVHRIIKMSVQLTGLVIRRLTRMIIPLFTFLAAFVALIKLDGKLLLNLIPLAVLYVIALYFINRHAARNQVKLIGISEKANKQIGIVIDDMLFKNKTFDAKVKNDIDQSDYRFFSKLRYRRRLAEIHVTWVNTLFLVLGSALIVLDFGLGINGQKIDWMHLILFLVALRYAANGLQQMASATVAFSRFLPESELVFQILNPHSVEEIGDKSGLVFYFDDRSEIESLLPQLLKLRYGVEHHALLKEQLLQDNGLNHSDHNSFWVYSARPVLFKQAVKRYQTAIQIVICRIGSQIKQYEDINQFLDEFDPQSILSLNKSSQMSYDDDEIY